MTFERRCPPLELNVSAAAIAKHAQSIYAETGKELKVTDTVVGGAVDYGCGAGERGLRGDFFVLR